MKHNPLKYVAFLIAGIFLLIIPFLFDAYYIHIFNLIGIWIILTSSLNLILGYTGQLSFAQIGLFAVGAYTSAILSIKGMSFWIAFPISAVVSGLFGFLIGLLVLRFKTHFFAIVTLAFGEIIRLVIYNWRDVTGGPNGIYNIPLPSYEVDIMININIGCI